MTNRKPIVMIASTKQTQQEITPIAALEILRLGNECFVANEMDDRNWLHEVIDTAEGQYPFAIILSWYRF